MKLSKCLLAKSCVFLVLACLVYTFRLFYMPHFVQEIIRPNMLLLPGTKASEIFSKSGEGLIQHVFVFSLTNEAEYLNGQPPKFEELGPYTFRVVVKRELTWKKTYVSYSNRYTYFYDPSRSNNLKDEMKIIVNETEQEIRTIKVLDFLYEGTNDTIPIIGKTSFIGAKNNSESLEFTVHTGLHGDLSELNTFLTHGKLTFAPYYRLECKQLYGSPGGLFPNMKDLELSKLQYFNPELCRPWPLEYKETENFEALELRRYVPGNDFLSPSNDKYKQACYEPRSIGLQGAFDASACNDDYPIVLSLPHFLNADKKLLEDVKGLSPNLSKHEFSMGIHKYGFVVDPKVRVQVNVAIRNEYRKTPLVYPILWHETVRDLKARIILAEKIYDSFILLQDVSTACADIIAFILLVMAFVILLLAVLNSTRKDKEKLSKAKSVTQKTTLLESKSSIVKPSEESSTVIEVKTTDKKSDSVIKQPSRKSQESVKSVVVPSVKQTEPKVIEKVLKDPEMPKKPGVTFAKSNDNVESKSDISSVTSTMSSTTIRRDSPLGPSNLSSRSPSSMSTLSSSPYTYDTLVNIRAVLPAQSKVHVRR